EASASEQSDLWPRFVKMHSGYKTYQQRTKRKIPVVILEPETDAGIASLADR
ncbi:MAG: nitroreductase/quinone reductase family protein, partial [Acidobacteria bacterium]|nr:nitroreductase/quinone reductase family protein [Acidobacteriota bacterium]